MTREEISIAIQCCKKEDCESCPFYGQYCTENFKALLNLYNETEEQKLRNKREIDRLSCKLSSCLLQVGDKLKEKYGYISPFGGKNEDEDFYCIEAPYDDLDATIQDIIDNNINKFNEVKKDGTT